jgi:hypothetical protein
LKVGKIEKIKVRRPKSEDRRRESGKAALEATSGLKEKVGKITKIERLKKLK